MSNIASFSSGFFNSQNGDRLYNAEQMSRLFDGLIHDGVYAGVGGRFLVTADEDTDNSVLIDSGRAWFDHTWCLLESQIEYSGMIPAPPVSKYRYDAIVLDINHETRDNDILVVSGEELSISGTVSARDAATLAGSATISPHRPMFANTSNHKQYPICYILRRPGVARILAADIVYMVGTTVCPLVTGVVTSGNINNYISGWAAQWELFKNTYETGAEEWFAAQQSEFDTWETNQETDFTTWSTAQKNEFATWMAGEKTDFDTWFANLQYILDGDVAGHLQNEIDALDAIKTAGMDSGYVRAGKKANTTAGSKATAEGNDTTASGTSSHAEGYGTTASRQYSHAEGYGTIAGNTSSHAEGYLTTASGQYSHAEGDSTTASGQCSHAEGNDTTASSRGSHAEGDSTTASGTSSHAEGYGTTASRNSSHAEGYRTTASGQYSHAEGYLTTASGQCSHAGGYGIVANADGSFVHGVSDGQYSNVFGFGGRMYNVDISEQTIINALYGAAVACYYTTIGSNDYLQLNLTQANEDHSDLGGGHIFILTCLAYQYTGTVGSRGTILNSAYNIMIITSADDSQFKTIEINKYGTPTNDVTITVGRTVTIKPKVNNRELRVNLIRLS